MFRPTGVTPYFIQIANPSLYSYNEEQEEAGSKSRKYPDDVNHIPDTRSDPYAYTPIYRGNQNLLLDYFDTQASHGISASAYYTDGTWYEWDGITTKTPFAPLTATAAEESAIMTEWYDYIFPNAANANFCMRGLKQLYEANTPFADESNPTVKEFEMWNNKVLNHFRAMLGLPQIATLSWELMIKCKWSDERRTDPTDPYPIWNDVPGTLDSAYGPCMSSMHCGETFVPPSQNEQQPYWNDIYMNTRLPPKDQMTGSYGSAGIMTWWNGTAMTWLSRTIKGVVYDGPTGHGGPFLTRNEWGFSRFGILTKSARFKWEGTQNLPPTGYKWALRA